MNWADIGVKFENKMEDLMWYEVVQNWIIRIRSILCHKDPIWYDFGISWAAGQIFKYFFFQFCTTVNRLTIWILLKKIPIFALEILTYHNLTQLSSCNHAKCLKQCNLISYDIISSGLICKIWYHMISYQVVPNSKICIMI